MSVYKIHWTRRSLRRLESIGAEISNDNSDAAKSVVLRLASCVNALADFPAMGRVGRIGGTRELVLADIPYIIAYRVIGDRIDVLTIIHTSQKWPQE